MRIYLAGFEKRKFLFEVASVKNIFVSFFTLKKITKIQALFNVVKERKISCIVDSGAHSFFTEHKELRLTNRPARKEHKKYNPDEFFYSYVNWLKKYWDYFDYYVELDIGEITGQEKVKQWREVLKKENLFKKCITVVHPKVVSWEDYLKLIDTSESRYIALEGKRPDRTMLPYNKYVKKAYENKVKIHGFALVDCKLLSSVPFYSVDSTSWISGSQYGICTSFDRNSISLKGRGFKDKKTFLNDITSDINFKVAMHSKPSVSRPYRDTRAIGEYLKLEKTLTELWKKRGIVWLD